MNRSCPFCACASDAALAGRSTRLMLSTITLVLFFCPHCLVKVLLNHVSKAGTKWLHWRILSVFCWAAARSGNKNAGPIPAATAPAPVSLIKSRRDTLLPFFLSMFSLLCPFWVFHNSSRRWQMTEVAKLRMPPATAHSLIHVYPHWPKRRPHYISLDDRNRWIMERLLQGENNKPILQPKKFRFGRLQSVSTALAS